MEASRMKELRESLGLSMPEFGRRLGCSRDVIANIEYGRVKPKEVFLDHMCEIYGANRHWLSTGKGTMFDENANDEKVREATEIFRSLSSDLRELSLTQMRSLQKLMATKPSKKSDDVRDNVDTIRLMAAMLGAQEFSAMKNQNGETAQIGKYISVLMKERKMSFEQLTDTSLLEEKELRRILDSEGAPSREALIAVSLALSLDVEETQRLLTAAGLPSLYAKNRRDSACLFALMKGHGVKELNELLTELEETIL